MAVALGKTFTKILLNAVPATLESDINTFLATIAGQNTMVIVSITISYQVTTPTYYALIVYQLYA